MNNPVAPIPEVTRKLVENRGEDTTPCIKVVGTLEALYVLADFWERNAQSFHLIATNCLLDYTYREEFSAEQSTAYKQGLADIPLFLQKCVDERRMIEEEAVKSAATPPE